MAISTTELYVEAAVHHVKRARNHLLCAVGRMDAAGFDCEALCSLYADSAELVSNWAGRNRPPEHPDPLLTNVIFLDAARAYRRQKGRSY